MSASSCCMASSETAHSRVTTMIISIETHSTRDMWVARTMHSGSGIYGRKKAKTGSLATTKTLGKVLCEPAEHINQQRNAGENGFHRAIPPDAFQHRRAQLARMRPEGRNMFTQASPSCSLTTLLGSCRLVAPRISNAGDGCLFGVDSGLCCVGRHFDRSLSGNPAASASAVLGPTWFKRAAPRNFPQALTNQRLSARRLSR